MNNLTTSKNNNLNVEQHIIFVPKKECSKILMAYFHNLKIPFQGDKNEFYSLIYNDLTYLLVGLGETITSVSLKKTAKKFSWDFREKILSQATQLHPPSTLTQNELKNLLIGLWAGTYKIVAETDKTNPHPLHQKETEIVIEQEPYSFNVEETFLQAQYIVEGQFIAMDLLNLPPNKKNSEKVGQYAKELADLYGFNCTILNREGSKEAGLDAFLAVNQGSEFEPNFIILEYKPKSYKKSIGWVGKCVTFDTGGISIKPAQNMHYMKSDMGGATTVLGAFLTVVKMQFPVHLVAILPATDNAVSRSAYLPGDVFNSHAKKTIEVINTDAEGRMTLADGLSYMVTNYNPDVLMDLATLTGSVVRTFGYKCAGLFSNDNNLQTQLSDIGFTIDERVWPLPLWDEYLEDLKSDVADIKQISNTPLSDVIYAAKFLQQFTHDHPAWVHLDIAGVAFGNNAYSHDKSATGYGVQLLAEFVQKCIE